MQEFRDITHSSTIAQWDMHHGIDHGRVSTNTQDKPKKNFIGERRKGTELPHNIPITIWDISVEGSLKKHYPYAELDPNTHVYKQDIMEGAYKRPNVQYDPQAVEIDLSHVPAHESTGEIIRIKRLRAELDALKTTIPYSIGIDSTTRNGHTISSESLVKAI